MKNNIDEDDMREKYRSTTDHENQNKGIYNSPVYSSPDVLNRYKDEDEDKDQSKEKNVIEL